MIIKRTKRFDKDFMALPKQVQERIINQTIPTLFTNSKDKSLQAKKIKEETNRWCISVDIYYCITLEVSEGVVIFRCIGPKGNF